MPRRPGAKIPSSGPFYLVYEMGGPSCVGTSPPMPPETAFTVYGVQRNREREKKKTVSTRPLEIRPRRGTHDRLSKIFKNWAPRGTWAGSVRSDGPRQAQVFFCRSDLPPGLVLLSVVMVVVALRCRLAFLVSSEAAPFREFL